MTDPLLRGGPDLIGPSREWKRTGHPGRVIRPGMTRRVVYTPQAETNLKLRV